LIEEVTVKVSKEEQAFWDAVFLMSMSEKTDRGFDAVRASEEAAMCADVALAARRARSQ
jgi:hypothetical protein